MTIWPLHTCDHNLNVQQHLCQWKSNASDDGIHWDSSEILWKWGERILEIKALWWSNFYSFVVTEDYETIPPDFPARKRQHVPQNKQTIQIDQMNTSLHHVLNQPDVINQCECFVWPLKKETLSQHMNNICIKEETNETFSPKTCKSVIAQTIN